nr:hypothetical protein [Nitrosomonas nitrosa]
MSAAKPPRVGKVFKQRIINLDTGETEWVDLGTMRPISAVADLLKIGPRHLRDLMVTMDMLQPEFDPYANKHRRRLAPWVVESGLGRRIERRAFKDHTPFDVLTEEGVTYVRDHIGAAVEGKSAPVVAARDALRAFEERRGTPLDTEGRIRWLSQCCPGIRPCDVSDIAGASRAYVSRILAEQERERGFWSGWRKRPLNRSTASPVRLVDLDPAYTEPTKLAA